MLVLNNVPTQDAYSDALTLSQDTADTITYVIANASVRARFRPVARTGGAEAPFGDEVLLPPQSNTAHNVSGVQFRSAIPGQPARIVAVLTGPLDPQLAAGTPFTQTLTAAGGVGALALTVLYDSGPLAAAAAVIDSGGAGFSTSLTDLIIRIIARGDGAGATGVGSLRFNGDASASYDDQFLAGNAAVASAAEALGGTSMTFGLVPATTAAASKAAVYDILIPFYSNGDWHKDVMTKEARVTGTGSGAITAAQRTGIWRSVAPIARVQAILATGNFAPNSRMIVYGQ